MTDYEDLNFRIATEIDIPIIWEILQQAISRRKNDGSTQWQDGYPNLETVKADVEKGQNYVLTENGVVIVTAALIFNDEPAYDEIEGKWLSDGEFLVVHRVGVSNEVAGKGYAKKLFVLMEDFAKGNQVFSIKVDTNYDNLPMLKILEKLGYTYCGEVYFRGGARKAFEKLLN